MVIVKLLREIFLCRMDSQVGDEMSADIWMLSLLISSYGMTTHKSLHIVMAGTN